MLFPALVLALVLLLVLVLVLVLGNQSPADHDDDHCNYDMIFLIVRMRNHCPYHIAVTRCRSNKGKREHRKSKSTNIIRWTGQSHACHNYDTRRECVATTKSRQEGKIHRGMPRQYRSQPALLLGEVPRGGLQHPICPVLQEDCAKENIKHTLRYLCTPLQRVGRLPLQGWQQIPVPSEKHDMMKNGIVDIPSHC